MAHSPFGSFPMYHSRSPTILQIFTKFKEIDFIRHIARMGAYVNVGSASKPRDSQVERICIQGTSLGATRWWLSPAQLGRTDLVQWDAVGHHFPRLQSLVLTHCLNLEAIPFGLSEVSALQNMELHWLKPSATDSARTIRRQKLLIQQEQGLGNSKFKLLIYPPDLESDYRLSPPVVALRASRSSLFRKSFPFSV